MLDILDQIENASPTHGSFSTVADFVYLAFNVLLGIGVGISVIGIILAGIKYITAGSDIKATAQAKQALTYSIVAFLLVIGAFTIYTIINNLLGVGYR